MANTGINIKEVKTRHDLSNFIELPYTLHKKDPSWIPPLKSEVKSILTDKNPFYRHAEKRFFLAQKNGKTVGRIAAFIDYNLQKIMAQTGQIGFFESENNIDIASALFKAAEGYLYEKGVKSIIGPLNPSTNFECGLLIKGFEHPPYIMMPHNPDYYPPFFEHAGYKKGRDLFAYTADIPEQVPERMRKLGEYAIKRNSSKGIKVRTISLKHFSHELKKVQEIYNSAWEGNWAFVPMEPEEMAFIAEKLRPIILEDLILIAEQHNEPIGFIMCLPNYNEILKDLNGKGGILNLLKLFTRKAKIKGIRLLTMGIKKPYRDKGIDAMLYYEGMKNTLKHGYRKVEFSWILEDNAKTNKATTLMNAQLYKVFRIYKKIL